MSSATPMTGAQVKGYRTLSQAEIDSMNELKNISRAFLAKLYSMGEDQSDYDKRWVAIARTHMQEACMAACRAVARPDDDC